MMHTLTSGLVATVMTLTSVNAMNEPSQTQLNLNEPFTHWTQKEVPAEQNSTPTQLLHWANDCAQDQQHCQRWQKLYSHPVAGLMINQRRTSLAKQRRERQLNQAQKQRLVRERQMASATAPLWLLATGYVSQRR